MPDQRRIAIVGLGVIAPHWAAPLARRDDVAIVAAIEPDPAMAARFAERTTLDVPLCADLAAAVRDHGADVVVNCTPPRFHRQVIEEALELGCDVLSEKPLAATYADAVAVVEAARRTGRTLAVMQNRRYHPAIRRLRAALEDGAIGELVVAAADMWLAPHPVARSPREMPHPLLVDMAVHSFDQARYLTGSEPVSVHCVERHPAHSWFAGDAVATATFELANGAILSYRGSWVTPGFPTSYDCSWRLAGSTGTAWWDGHGELAVERAIAGEMVGEYERVEHERLAFDEPRDRTGHGAGVDALVDKLVAGEQPETHAGDNIRSLAMSFAALKSAAEGRVVTIAELDAEL